MLEEFLVQCLPAGLGWHSQRGSAWALCPPMPRIALGAADVARLFSHALQPGWGGGGPVTLQSIRTASISRLNSSRLSVGTCGSRSPFSIRT